MCDDGQRNAAMDVEVSNPGEADIMDVSPDAVDKSTDANDYSRFDTISVSDTDDESTPQSSSKPDEEPLLSASSCMHRCSELKDLGNAAFKCADTAGARAHYTEGIALLKRHTAALTVFVSAGSPALASGAPNADDASKLLAVLYGNLCMAYLKEENWSKTIESASHVLALDVCNVKALFRRGQSYSKSGFFVEAKADLQRCLELEQSNAAAKLALADNAKQSKAKDAEEKRQFGKMFGGRGMYLDQVAKSERDQAEKQKKAAEREELLQDEWSKSKLERRRSGQEVQTFEDFKVDFEMAEKDKAEEEKKRKAAKAQADASGSGASAPPQPRPSKKADSSDDEDEEDLRDMRGYKTTSDGRKTTFFNNELDPAARALIGDITPKAIVVDSVSSSGGGVVAPSSAALGAFEMDSGMEEGSSGSSSSSSSTSTSISNSSSSNGGGGEKVVASSWNKAGTWEERDVTALVSERLKVVCSEAARTTEVHTPTPLTLCSRITSVKKAEGEAQVILARGKKRHVYDFHVVLEFEIMVDSTPQGQGQRQGEDDTQVEAQEPPSPGADASPDAPLGPPAQAAPAISKKVKGTIELLDLTPTSSQAGYDAHVKFSKPHPPGLGASIELAAEALRVEVTKRIQAFEAEFKEL